MTISSEVRKSGPYAGNDVTTSFPFSFKVFSADDVVVVLTDPAGIETTLTGSGTDYSVTLNADQDTAPGGTVEKVSALATDYLLTITSSVPTSQPMIRPRRQCSITVASTAAAAPTTIPTSRRGRPLRDFKRSSTNAIGILSIAGNHLRARA